VVFRHRGGVIDPIAHEQDALAFLLSRPHDGDLLFQSEPGERFLQRQLRGPQGAIASDENTVDVHLRQFPNRLRDKRPLRFAKQNRGGLVPVDLDQKAVLSRLRAFRMGCDADMVNSSVAVMYLRQDRFRR
jgi:hypothetical protein